jgi:3'-phosphoadenosine 5'-phosphosulfate sulfotransferase (PAPS reductase)/FAD synthetase
MNEKSVRRQKLLQMQALPLLEKIEATKRRIREWLIKYPEATVSFSGGKDSTVLLHIARQIAPRIEARFSNTGLEFPEIVNFVGSIPGVTIVRPKYSFLEVIEKIRLPGCQ